MVPTWCHWWCTSLVGRYVAWWRFSCEVAAAELIQAFYGKSTKPPGLTNPRPASKIRRLIKSLFELRFNTLRGPGVGWLGHSRPPYPTKRKRAGDQEGMSILPGYKTDRLWKFVMLKLNQQLKNEHAKKNKYSKFKVLLSRMEFSIWKKMIWSASC